jgi:DNA end-binding protein Ku
MPRVIWKGAISFGLVHVPVALMPASQDSGIDFDWLDRRSMDPVGYQRINKRTGKVIDSEHIVRGVKVGDGRYVVLGDEEIQAAYPRTTQTIEIESFVQPAQVPFTLLEKPYYLEPLPRGEKVYALLREALKEAGVAGVARLVLHTKEHLAVLVPVGPALMLDTLRWSAEIRPWDQLKLPPEGRKEASVKDAELKMAVQLIGDMTEDWQPERFTDRFSDAIRALVDRRAEAGETADVQPLEDGAAPAPTNVVDLTELLKRSLGQRAKNGAAKAAAPAPAPAPAPRKAPARKRA